MVSDYGSCDICKGKLKLKEKREIASTIYHILVCEKCNKQIARRID